MQRSPKFQENQIIHLHPTSKVRLHPMVVGDAGVKKSGINGMLRRRAGIGGRRVGASGLATQSKGGASGLRIRREGR